MANEDFIRQLAINLHKFTPRVTGEVLVARGLAGNVPSGETLARRVLKDMEARGELTFHKFGTKGVYSLPGLEGYDDHAEMITDALVKLACRWDISVARERLIESVAIRPDAMVLVRDGARHCCLIIEAVNTENIRFFEGKLQVWQKWGGACDYLSHLFGCPVPFFHLVTHGKKMGDTLTLTETIQMMEVE